MLVSASRRGIWHGVCADYDISQRQDIPSIHSAHHELASSAVVMTCIIVVVAVVSVSAVVAIQAKEPDKQWDVTCSYCEVYNELIFDLLQDNSPPLDLRLPHCTHRTVLTTHTMYSKGTIK